MHNAKCIMHNYADIATKADSAYKWVRAKALPIIIVHCEFLIVN